MRTYLQILGLVLVAVLVALALLRLSSDALALIIGLLLGISALMPLSFLLYKLARQPSRPHDQHPTTPPITIIQPPTWPGLPAARQNQLPSPTTGPQPLLPTSRQWSMRVFGEELPGEE